MNKILILIILFFLKFTDLYITYIFAFKTQVLYETSPMVNVLDLSFSSFLIINIIFLFIVSFLFLKYDVKKTLFFKNEKDLKTFISKNIFYKEHIVLNDLFKLKGINNKLLIYLLINSLPVVLIINTIIALIINYFLIMDIQISNVSNISNFIASNNLFFVINIIIVFGYSFLLLRKNFKNVR